MRRLVPIPGQGTLFGAQMLHLYRFDLSAIRVDPRGNRIGEKMTRGAWRCVTCAVDGEFAQVWADCDCCPGRKPTAAPLRLLKAAPVLPLVAASSSDTGEAVA